MLQRRHKAGRRHQASTDDRCAFVAKRKQVNTTAEKILGYMTSSSRYP
jgi:hypothetical protein